jgi:hypothetical protein
MNQSEAETIGSRSRIAVAGGVLFLAGGAGFLAAGSPLDAPFRLLVAKPEMIAGHVDALLGPVQLAAAAALLVAIGGLLVCASPRRGGAVRALTVVAGLLAGVSAICELQNATGMRASLEVISRSEAVPKPAEVQAAADAGAQELVFGHSVLLACGGCLVIASLIRGTASSAGGIVRVLPLIISVPAGFLLCGGWLLVCLHAGALVRLLADPGGIRASDVVGRTLDIVLSGITAGVGLGFLSLALVLRGVLQFRAIRA